METRNQRIRKLKKAQLVALATKRCIHGHLYLEHFSCAEKEGVLQEPPPERIGFLDIETSNLAADFGIMLSYAIKEEGGKIYADYITPKELESKGQDKRLVRECISVMEKFDRLVGFYSARFDMPYIRSRAMAHDLHYPAQGEIKHTDLWFQARSKLRLHRNRLQTVCDFLEIPSKQHKLDGPQWIKALTGRKSALKHIFEHNKEDVISLEEAYHELRPYFKLTNTTL